MGFRVFAKMVALVLICVILSTGNISAFSDLSSDILNNAYEHEIEIITALGLIDTSSEFKSNEYFTRANLAVLAVTLAGYDTSFYNKPSELYFRDVPVDYWAAVAIGLAYQNEYMAGLDNELFLPDEQATYGQIVKVIMSVMGYSFIAENLGGYPVGYMSAANSSKVISGINRDVDEHITSGEVAKLVYNALAVGFFEQVSYGEVSKFKVSDNGKTILSIRDLYIVKGIVSANEYTSIYSSGKKSIRGHISIGEDIFYTGKTNAADFLGYSVELYCREEKSLEYDTILYIHKEKKINELKIDAQDILDVDNSLNPKLLYELSNGNKQSLKLAKNVCTIYNGRSIQFDSSLFFPVSGNVRLIDNGGGYFDVAFINDYEHFVISSSDIKNNRFYFNFGELNGKPYLDLSGSELDFRIINRGEPVGAKELMVGRALSVAYSADGSYCEIYVSSDIVSGEVEEIEHNDNGSMIITIAGKATIVDRNARNTNNIVVGKHVKLYMGAFGKVVEADISESLKFNYAFLLAAGSETNSTLAKMKVKLYLTSGEIKTFVLASRARFNGDVLPHNTICDILNDMEPQLIIYEINEAEEIVDLKTAFAKTGDYNFDKDNFTLDLSIPKIEKQTSRPRAAQHVISGVGTINTITFVVPEKENGIYNEKKLSIEREYYEAGQYFDNFKMYDVGDSNCATASLAVGTATKEIKSYETSMIVVKSISKISDEEGIELTKMYGYFGGKYSSWIFDENAYNSGVKNTPVSELKAGDIILLNTDNRGLVDRYYIIFELKSNDMGMIFKGGSGYGDGVAFQLAYGRCVYNQNTITTIDSSAGIYPFLHYKTMKIYILDLSSGMKPTITEGTVGDIIPANRETGYQGDEIVIHGNRFSLREAMIIRR